MQIKMFSLSAFFLLGFFLTGVKAQEALSAGGGNASGSGGSVSYTVGQVACTFYTTVSGSVSQGVQQPYEIYVEAGTGQGDGVNLICASYPNPVTDILILEIGDYQSQQLVYRLYDTNGNLLKNREIRGNVTTISMESLAMGTYFLKVVQTKYGLPQSGQQSSSYGVKTFKIIKN
ncbi:MAG: T9SS type A sorting domain-containing protein [Bacteroidota bacterium]